MENKQHETEEEVIDTAAESEQSDEKVDSADNVELIEESEETDQEKESLLAELEDTKTRLLRTQADFDNFRRRSRDEKAAAAKYRAKDLVESLLPVIDNFERALAVEVKDEQSKSVLQGMEMVYRQLKDALEKEGVEEINAVGESFDPHYHQAVMQVQSEDHESNTVIEVLQKGYQLKDRVIRPAMVKVSE
ncbi:nucleotide exchange factor GrpE [Bacillus taeanensis]|uniref:Protein GrpE n=1 Tax=Bacillus taeanensis TaxID=273032 RepID=A0A366XZD2_9BACI|nr:nucleotide exchange factor GrpE [Bacillus taeanensis]RBW70495.1 nucleotide exchange factor GrpE [Bacillus taeanensis]